MNVEFQRAILSIMLWKGSPLQRYTATVLTTALVRLQHGKDTFSADDVPDNGLGPDDRNVIGAAFGELANAKTPLIDPMMVTTPLGAQPVKVKSKKQQGHGNPINVWRVNAPLAEAWLKRHGYIVPEVTPQTEMELA